MGIWSVASLALLGLAATLGATVGGSAMTSGNPPRPHAFAHQRQTASSSESDDFLRLATQARSDARGSANRASNAFAEAMAQRFGDPPFQAAAANRAMSSYFGFAIIDAPKPSVRLDTPRDRLILTLIAQLTDSQPLKLPPAVQGVCVTVNKPGRIDTLDVERILLTRAGRQVDAIANTLKPSTVIAPSGTSVQRHEGAVCWSSDTFATPADEKSLPTLFFYLSAARSVEWTPDMESLRKLNGRTQK